MEYRSANPLKTVATLRFRLLAKKEAGEYKQAAWS